MRKSWCLPAVICLMMWISPEKGYAQTTPTLVDLMFDTFDRNIGLARTPAGVGVVAHTGVFPGLVATEQLITNVSQQIGAQVSTFPLGSSSGGFTYGYDASLGTFARTTQTFGPAFAERAATIGKGKFSFAVNYIHQGYDTLDGKDLKNGEIKFTLFHQQLNPRSYVEGDVIQAGLVMNLKSDTTALLFNYGVTDKLDVGLALPIVRVSMNLTYSATILDFATHTFSPNTHRFADGSKSQDFNASGSASGIGDVVVRGKYTFFKRGAQGLAAGLDLHVPSGDEANMLGTGATQTKIFLIASGLAGQKVAPHVNIGYTVTGGGEGRVGDQVNYVGGAEIAASRKVTVVGDIIGQTFRNSLRLQDSSISHQYQQGPDAPQETTTLQTISEAIGNLNSLLGAGGVKINPWGNLLISAHVLFPLNDSGLRSRIIPVVGIDYSF